MLGSLERLYVIVNQYDPCSVYDIDETCLFFGLVSRYTNYLPNESILQQFNVRKKLFLDRVNHSCLL